jgi:predicted metal-dependent hydrolase
MGELHISVTRKAVKHARLSVHPPEGHVTLVIPHATRLDVARAFAMSKLSWIRTQQAKMQGQARETPRQFIERETHRVWGQHYLLILQERDEKPSVKLDHRHITLIVRPDTPAAKREELMQTWQRRLLHEAIPPLIEKWEAKLGVTVKAYFLQRMKTLWGSCNPRAGHIRLNTELVKKPKHLLEYVIVHELLHLLEPSHNQRFTSLLDTHYPSWRQARAELNELPLRAETWPAQVTTAR